MATTRRLNIQLSHVVLLWASDGGAASFSPVAYCGSGHLVLKLLDGERLCPAFVEHGVTVGTHRQEVRDGIDRVVVVICDLRQRFCVVDMNEPVTDCAVALLEIQIAHFAGGSVVLDARVPCAAVTLVLVDFDSGLRALWNLTGTVVPHPCFIA